MVIGQGEFDSAPHCRPERGVEVAESHRRCVHEAIRVTVELVQGGQWELVTHAIVGTEIFVAERSVQPLRQIARELGPRIVGRIIERIFRAVGLVGIFEEILRSTNPVARQPQAVAIAAGGVARLVVEIEKIGVSRQRAKRQPPIADVDEM